MPLTTGELDRIRFELGYHLLENGAQPFIGVHQVFEQVILPFLREGNDTTSSTVVTAAESATFRTLTVASATGITLHSRVAVDVDDLLEMATVRSISGLQIGVLLKKAHPGTYPVTVDGGLQMVREALSNIYITRQQIADTEGTGAIKKVDEIEFYEARKKTHLDNLRDKLAFYRADLMSALGVPRSLMAVSCGGSVALT